MRWRSDLISELGGEAALTVAQRTLIEQAARTKLFLDALDAWLIEQPKLVNSRKRAVVPALLQRQQLADALARYLTQLAEMAPAKAAAGVTDPDFPFLNPVEAKRLHQLQAKVDAGEIDVLDLYRLAAPIFKAEQQAMMARREAS